jgi:hypothetical protein
MRQCLVAVMRATYHDSAGHVKRVVDRRTSPSTTEESQSGSALRRTRARSKEALSVTTGSFLPALPRKATRETGLSGANVLDEAIAVAGLNEIVAPITQ